MHRSAKALSLSRAYHVANHVAVRSGRRAKLPADPVDYEKQIYQRGLQFERPRLPFQWEALESQAVARLSAESKGYLYGNAGTGETARKNREAFARWSIVPSRLVKTDGLPNLSAKVFGEQHASPIALAPVGVQKIFNPDGEEATAGAAAKEGVPYIMSTASSTTIEEVAKANGGGTRWYQLYWPSNKDNDVTASMLKRARNAGFSALFVTLDTYILGW